MSRHELEYPRKFTRFGPNPSVSTPGSVSRQLDAGIRALMDLNFNVFNLLILVGAFNGFVSATLLLSLRKHTSARFLGLAILLFSLFNAWLLIGDTALGFYLPWISRLPLLYLTGLGPCLYFYTRYLIEPDRPWKTTDNWHFAPMLLDLAFGLTYSWYSLEENVPTFAVSVFTYLSPFQTLLTAVSIPIYLYLAQRFVKQAKLATANPEMQQRASWIKQVFVAYLVFWIAWVPLEAIDLAVFNYELSITNYYFLFLWQAFIAYWIGLKGYLQARSPAYGELQLSLQGSSIEVEESNSMYQSATIGGAPEYEQTDIDAIERALCEEELYLDPKLSLESLARSVQLPKRKLSFVINDHYQKNFNELVNAYRVEAVKAKLIDPAYANYSILGVALDCGFNSKSSFNRIFKRHCDITPVEYVAKHREKAD